LEDGVYWNPAFYTEEACGRIIVSITSYLETAPLREIIRIAGRSPQNGVPFSGYARQHPSDPEKVLLIEDPLGIAPRIMEFKKEDLLGVEDTASPVSQGGTEVLPMIKIWVRRGAMGVMLDPFEVDEPIKLMNQGRLIQERILL
jgi:hypothetical protein